MNEFDEKEFKLMTKYINKFFNISFAEAIKESELSLTNIFNGYKIITFECVSGDKVYPMVYDKITMFLKCGCENGVGVGVNNKQICKHKMYALNNLDKYMRRLK